MYKVERYRFLSETTDQFTKGNFYYLRLSKDGMKRFLSTDNPNFELAVNNGRGMSLISDCNSSYLRDNFIYVDYEIYKSYKDFTRRKLIEQTIDRYGDALKALAEIEDIESGELPRKTAREFLKESRRADNND